MFSDQELVTTHYRTFVTFFAIFHHVAITLLVTLFTVANSLVTFFAICILYYPSIISTYTVSMDAAVCIICISCIVTMCH